MAPVCFEGLRAAGKYQLFLRIYLQSQLDLR